MESISQKLNQLPQVVKDQLSNPELLDALMAIEKRVGARLTLPLVKIVLGELAEDAIAGYLADVLNLSPEVTTVVAHELMALLMRFDVPVPSFAPVGATEGKEKPSFISPNSGVQPIREVPVAEKSITFSSADEAEARMYTVPTRNNMTDYESLIDQVLNEFHFVSMDEIMAKRLRNVILARLKGVRDDMEATEVLIKNKKVGGLEFTAEQSRELLKIIGRHLSAAAPTAVSDGQRIVFPTKKPFALREISNLDTKRQQAEGKVERQVFPVEKSQTNTNKAFNPSQPSPKLGEGQAGGAQVQASTFSRPLTAPTKSADRVFETAKSTMAMPTIEEEDGLPVVQMPNRPTMAEIDSFDLKKTPPAPAQRVAPVVPTEKPVESLNKEMAASSVAPTGAKEEAKGGSNPFGAVSHQATPMRPAPYKQAPLPQKNADITARKPSVDGVKFVRQLAGPVEELEQMTLIEFRRLGATPAEATAKVRAMIDILEHESYTKRLAGITAWGKNEISQFYRLLGHTSMKDGKSIETVIGERLSAGKPTLTMEEFSAVMELNQDLRY